MNDEDEKLPMDHLENKLSAFDERMAKRIAEEDRAAAVALAAQKKVIGSIYRTPPARSEES